jgi:hypothetical protein
MRTSTKLIIGLVAAAVTYGSLWAIAGPRHFHRNSYQGRGGYCQWQNDARMIEYKQNPTGRKSNATTGVKLKTITTIL